MITFGIPSFNRVEYLEDLVSSIYKCDIKSFELLIVEDCSPQRVDIRKTVKTLINKYSSSTKPINYVENEINIGFDKNLKKIINEALGEHIIFIGNDDIVVPKEMTKYVNETFQNANACVFLRGYKTFDQLRSEVTSTKIVHQSRWAKKYDDMNTIYRFSGIISGFCVNKKFASEIVTDKFDGGLFYQIYLAFAAYDRASVYLSSSIPVLCRRDIAPEFGHSINETEFVAGNYNLKSRMHMAQAHLDIAEHLKANFDQNFIKLYKKAMSQNIAPHLITLQQNKLRDMTKMYLFLIKIGIGRNLRSLAIYFISIIFNQTRTAIILNRISNFFRMSTR